jgi:hypothetical protein
LLPVLRRNAPVVDGGVGCNDSGEFMLVDQREDFLNHSKLQIRRNLHQHRFPGRIARLDMPHQFIQGRPVLQRTEPGRVRRRDIQHKIIADLLQPLE